LIFLVCFNFNFKDFDCKTQMKYWTCFSATWFFKLITFFIVWSLVFYLVMFKLSILRAYICEHTMSWFLVVLSFFLLFGLDVFFFSCFSFRSLDSNDWYCWFLCWSCCSYFNNLINKFVRVSIVFQILLPSQILFFVWLCTYLMFCV
jgi:hypothetical protein